MFVCLFVYRHDISHISNVYWHICHTNHQRTHQILNIGKLIHPDYLCIPDRPEHTSTPDHITKNRPVCHLDFYRVHLHGQPSLTTLTILSTPTKLTNLTTLIKLTDQKNYQDINAESTIVYFVLLLYFCKTIFSSHRRLTYDQ